MGIRELLLVEDSPDDEVLTRRALSRLPSGVNVRIAHDGMEAASLLGLVEAGADNVQPLPDLVLLDIRMPRMGGHEVLRRIRQNPRTATLDVVVLSSSDEPVDVAYTKKLGAEHVRKPIDYDAYLIEVVGIVKKHLAV